jgi:hypothetical protein
MAFHVNPNDVRNIFAYPGSSGVMKLNKDSGGSTPVWFPSNGSNAPFILTSHGKKDPDAAIEKLFNVNTGSDRNLLFCDPTATVLHMDALRVAKDSNKLLKALIANGDQYLKVDHPDGHSGNFSDGQALAGLTSAQASANQSDITLAHIGQILTLAQKHLSATALTTNSFVSFPALDFTIVKDGVHEIFKADKVNPVSRILKAVGTLKNTYAAGAKVYLTKGNHSVINTLPHHFISDSRPDHALFEQVTIKSAELQVGDNVYVLNHPIYKVFHPSGIWGGEHSFIAEIESRDNTSSVFRNAVKLGGHGLLNTTLLGMIDEMLEWNNLVLAILQSLTKIHLGNLNKNGRPTANATVDKNGFKFKFILRKENSIDMNVFEYNMPYDFSYLIKGKPKTFKETAGFVIKEKVSTQTSSFQVWQNSGTDSVTKPPIELIVNFTGALPPSPADQFRLSKWSFAPYLNSQAVSFDTHPLFKADDKTPNLLTFDDIVKSKPLFVTDSSGDAFVTRPRVDFRASYQTFLQTNGAI